MWVVLEITGILGFVTRLWDLEKRNGFQLKPTKVFGSELGGHYEVAGRRLVDGRWSRTLWVLSPSLPVSLSNR